MSPTDACRVRRMAAADLAAVLAWRNHPDTRAHMLTRHEITHEEHSAWFERASADASRALLIVEEASGPIGFVQFANARADEASSWGFYTVPGSVKGSGRRLCGAALSMAFRELGIHKVCGQAVALNSASIKLHTALGFRREGLLRQQIRLEGAYEDLVCFGLLRHEWAAGRTEES